MYQLKYQPLTYSMLMIHPALYRVDDLSDEVRKKFDYWKQTRATAAFEDTFRLFL